jgi:tripartite-type tricarboxylate transporter receptor subunit TctC
VRRPLLLVLLAFVALTPALAQSAANWPERPIRFVVPFTAGSSSDIVGRIVGQKLSERLGQQFIIENRPGGGGMIATDMVARAPADGYVLGMANTSTHGVAASTANVPYDPVKDFTPVAMLGSSPFLLALHPGLPVRSVADLIALAKAKPRALSYASAGPATVAHLAGVLFEKTAKVEITHVPYRGTAQSSVDLMEGRVDMQFGTIPPILTHVRAGKLRALAVTGTARSAALPDVPTIAEQGLPGFEASLWQAIVAPAATPPAIVVRLNREVAAVLADPEVRAAFAQHGVEPEPGSPEALGARIRADVQKWREVMAGAGIQ